MNFKKNLNAFEAAKLLRHIVARDLVWQAGNGVYGVTLSGRRIGLFLLNGVLHVVVNQEMMASSWFWGETFGEVGLKADFVRMDENSDFLFASENRVGLIADNGAGDSPLYEDGWFDETIQKLSRELKIDEIFSLEKEADKLKEELAPVLAALKSLDEEADFSRYLEDEVSLVFGPTPERVLRAIGGRVALDLYKPRPVVRRPNRKPLTKKPVKKAAPRRPLHKAS